MKTRPILAIRHVLRETLAGLRGAVDDVVAVQRSTDKPLTEQEREALLQTMPERDRAEWLAELADPYGLQKGVRLLAIRSRRQREVAQRWLDDLAETYPQVRDLAAMYTEADQGDGLDAWELHRWMMTPHRRLSRKDEDVSPIALLGNEPEALERLWREHIDVLTGPFP